MGREVVEESEQVPVWCDFWAGDVIEKYFLENVYACMGSANTLHAWLFCLSPETNAVTHLSLYRITQNHFPI